MVGNGDQLLILLLYFGDLVIDQFLQLGEVLIGVGRVVRLKVVVGGLGVVTLGELELLELFWVDWLVGG